jgi:general secretion pathway protein D
MNLDFTHGAKLGEVFLNLSKQSGVSIILHTSVSAQETSTCADLRGMSFQRALDTLLLQNDLFYKVMDPISIMVFKKTPQNLQEFETRLIKTFYLANADVDGVRQNFNALMPQLRVFIDKRLNAVTISATPGELAKAQQIVNNLDRGRGEVRLQMEIIEVAQKASVAAGLLQMVETPPSQDAKAVATVEALARVMQDGDSKLLASPDVRVLSGETAEVRIGRKLALNQADGGAKTTRNVATAKADDPRHAPSRDDLGERIKVRPRLHPDHEITLEMEYEVTDPLKPSEPGHPSLSERIIKTSVRIKDGETLVFGGLLEDEKRDRGAGGASGGKEKKDRLLVVKAVVVRWGEQ